jgi:hypothetical protein
MVCLGSETNVFDSFVVKFINEDSIISSMSLSETVKNSKRQIYINRLIERSEEQCMMKVEMLVRHQWVAA